MRILFLSADYVNSMVNLSRRDAFKGLAILPVGFLYFEAGCTSAQSNEFINLLNDISVGVEAALPIVGLLTGLPILPVIAGFVNIVDSAASKTATELSSLDPALTQAENILTYWTTAILAPSVISQLPTDVKNVNTQALIQSLVNAVNALLSQIASTIPAASVKTVQGNAIVHVQVPTAMAKVLSRTKSFPIDFAGKARLHSIKRNLDKYAKELKQ